MPIFNFSRRPNVQKLKTQEDVDGLIEALGYEEDHNVRLSAASALGRVGDSRAVEPLISALDDHPLVKEVAVKALGEIGDPNALDELIAELDNANWEIRGSIAKSLGKIADPRAIQPLTELLDDKSENVRWYASQALEAITGEAVGDDIDQWEKKINVRKEE